MDRGGLTPGPRAATAPDPAKVSSAASRTGQKATDAIKALYNLDLMARAVLWVSDRLHAIVGVPCPQMPSSKLVKL
jgi:hypothetical protein